MANLTSLMNDIGKRNNSTFFVTLNVPKENMINPTKMKESMSSFKNKIIQKYPKTTNIFYRYEVNMKQEYLFHAIGFKDEEE